MLDDYNAKGAYIPEHGHWVIASPLEAIEANPQRGGLQTLQGV